MKKRKLYAVVMMALGAGLASSAVSAQGFSSIFEKLDQFEKRLDLLENTQENALGTFQDELAEIQQGATVLVPDSSIVGLRSRLDRLALAMAELQEQRPAPHSSSVLSVLDSSVAALQLRLDHLAVEVQEKTAANGSAGLGNLTTDFRALIDELRHTIEQSPTRNITYNGQVRPRSEFRHPTPAVDNSFTSMRVRAQMKAVLNRDVSVFIQFQDVRLWGEEANTLTDFKADNFDLHQGYADLQKINGAPLSIRLGRQAIALGGQRLIGAVEWTQQGRVFDGVRLTLAPAGRRIDLVAFQLAEERASGIANNAYLTGMHAQVLPLEHASLDLYSFYNRVSGSGTDQLTLGLRWVGKPYRLEGAYQTGKRGGKDVSAYMLGARIGTNVAGDTGKVTLWYDYLSGSDDPGSGKEKVFDTLFATNHKFYGYADLFLNIPAHTKGRGLQDLAIKTKVSLHQAVSLAVDVHTFLLAQKGDLDTGHLGEEADLTLTYKYSSNLTLIGGFSHVFARDGFAAIGRLEEDVSFGYLMTNVAF